MKKKVFVLVIMIATLAVLLSACGQIDFTYKQNRDGTFTQKIAITIDDDSSVSSYGYTVESAVVALKKGFEKRGYTVSVSDNSVVAEKVFEDIDELKENEFANGIYVGEGDYSDNENAFVKDRTIDGEFKLSDSYISRNTITFAAVLMDGDFSLGYTKAQQIAGALVNTERSYTYITPYKSTTSNADSITEDDGYYIHTWDVSGDANPVITTEAIKGAMWYGIAIIVAVCVLLVVVVVKLIKERRK